ncbi:MAG TPA: phosphoglycerate mutase family protein [Vicinamibacterales bacterium]
MRSILSAILLLALAAPAAAQQVVFVVRHAERADTDAGGAAMMTTDPDLSAAGKARAEALATMLKDARIAAIYTTQYKRTKQTAEPLAKALGLTPVEVNSRDVAGVIEKLKTGENAMIVGHSNSVGAIIEQLGVPEPVALTDDEYDNLFIVVRGEKPTLVRLHFR